MMKNMDPQMMKNMTRMAQQMGGVPGMGGGGGGGGGGAGPSGAGGMPDMANMDMSNAAEMMGKMNPDMMKAGMEMMKGMVRRARNSAQFGAIFGAQFRRAIRCPALAIRRSALTRRAAPLQDPKAMAGMMKSATGKEMSEEQIAQVQSMMSNMSEEDMMKWSGRMQRLAGWAQKPVAAYRAAAAAVDRVPGGLLTVLCAVSGVLLVGHFTEWY